MAKLGYKSRNTPEQFADGSRSATATGATLRPFTGVTFAMFSYGMSASMVSQSRVARELVKYTPEHFKNIQCEVRSRQSDSGRELVYRIVCPDCPDEWSDTPGKDLHAATCDLVRRYEQGEASFLGVRITIEVFPDGRWRHSFEIISP
jgi:hypothetical protein